MPFAVMVIHHPHPVRLSTGSHSSSAKNYLAPDTADDEPRREPRRETSGGMDVHPDAIRARRASLAPRDTIARPSKGSGMGMGSKASRKSCACDHSSRSSAGSIRASHSGIRASAAAGSSNAKGQRRGSLHQRRLEQEAKQQILLESWFEQFDSNGDKQLDRSELRALLTHLYPGSPPEEGALDFLIKKATEIRAASMHLAGNPNGLVPWAAAVKTVARYGAYLREKARLDALMEELDVDESGGLDAKELGMFLQRISPDLEVTDGDVEFMLEQCDVDNDGSISADELMGLVQVWRLITTAGPEKRKGRLQAKQISILSRGKANFQTAASERQTGTTREAPVRESEEDLAAGAEANGSSSQAQQSKAPAGPSKQSTVVCVIL